jgi:hypothetical protein
MFGRYLDRRRGLLPRNTAIPPNNSISVTVASDGSSSGTSLHVPGAFVTVVSTQVLTPPGGGMQPAPLAWLVYESPWFDRLNSTVTGVFVPNSVKSKDTSRAVIALLTVVN